ncbi:hypothetical protein PILCRDRAFT_80278, partial [Piloderma croceum F 1598]
SDMPQLKDFSSWITIEDKKADEFNIEVSDDRKCVTCWIASKKFVICFQSLISREDTSRGIVKVDGRSCHGNISIRPKCMQVSRKAGLHTSTTTMKPFIFSMLQLTDDDLLIDTSAADALGEISIRMWRTRTSPYTHTQSGSLYFMKPPGELQLHERSKKLTSHHIKFGEEVSRPARIRVKYAYLDKEPIVTFIFKYRPFDILKANGIVPSTFGQQRPVSPEPEAEDTARQDVEEDQNASVHNIETSEVGRFFCQTYKLLRPTA